MSEINLGDKVKDRITGFKGIAVYRAEYLNGCVRIGITPEGLGKDGKPKETESFDVQQVEVVGKARKPKESRRVGGPQTAVPAQSERNP